MRAGYLVLLSLTVLAAQPASALNLRVDYSGSIAEVSGDLGSLSGSIGVGTSLSGHFTFDDSIAPITDYPEVLPDIENGEPGNPSQATYAFGSPAWVFHLDVGDITAETYPSSSTGGYTIDVVDFELNPTPDYASTVNLIAIVGEAPTGLGTTVLSRVDFELYGGEPGLPLHSSALTSVSWSPLDFPDAAIYLAFENGTGEFLWARGVIDEFSSSVPEPTSAALAAFAALALTGLGLARARS